MTRPNTGRDPLEKLVKLEYHQIGAFPFELSQLKFRHRKILKGLDPRQQCKIEEKEKQSDKCSSIDSEAYQSDGDRKPVTLQEIMSQNRFIKKVALI